jgi:hypothetical protein
MDIQARIPAALAALHNFIMEHDPFDLSEYMETADPAPGIVPDFGMLSEQLPDRSEKSRAEQRRDEIAQQMWDDYQALIREQGYANVDLE